MSALWPELLVENLLLLRGRLPSLPAYPRNCPVPINQPCKQSTCNAPTLSTALQYGQAYCRQLHKIAYDGYCWSHTEETRLSNSRQLLTQPTTCKTRVEIREFASPERGTHVAYQSHATNNHRSKIAAERVSDSSKQKHKVFKAHNQQTKSCVLACAHQGVLLYHRKRSYSSLHLSRPHSGEDVSCLHAELGS